MARMRDAFNHVVRYKTVVCPLCQSTHNIHHRGWLVPARRRVDKDGNTQIHEGLETQLYCRTEQERVVKQYTHEVKYIGYYIEQEIPF